MFNPKMILVFLGIPLGLFCIIFGGLGIIQELNLKNQAQTIEAKITQTRRADDGFDVKYSFEVNHMTYSAADGTGRKDLWVTLPAPKTDRLNVIYLPSDPWINRPVDKKGDPMEGTLTAFIVGLIAFPVGLAIAIIDIRRYQAAKKVEKA